MLNSLRIQNFKSWQDTGDIQFGSITGFFGTNSSGKTSILQFLLMLKQTVESSDRAQVLNLGDEKSYVELGTLYDIFHNHKMNSHFSFEIGWQLFSAVTITDFDSEPGINFYKGLAKLSSTIRIGKDFVSLENFKYKLSNKVVGLLKNYVPNQKRFYTVETEGFKLYTENEFNPSLSSKPIKFYGFPTNYYYAYQDNNLMNDIVQEFESNFDDIYYLGPL